MPDVYSMFFICLGVGFALVGVPAILFELWMMASARGFTLKDDPAWPKGKLDA